PLESSNFTYIRGVDPIAYRVHHRIRFESGRAPIQGRAELAVGRQLAARFPNLRPPHQIRFGRRAWTVTGIFSDGSSARESEIWTDLDLLKQDVHFGDGFASLHVEMKPGMGEAFQRALTVDGRLQVDAIPEQEFYSSQTKLADKLLSLGLIIAAILGVGAVFGGMNTMYAAVAHRSREIGVLRALGYSRSSVVASFVIESVLLAFAGGIAGEALAIMVAYATGLSSRLMSLQMYIFSFRLAPSAFLAGLAAAILIGALGGLLPAWRAARVGVIEALREA
ncbi:MAG TPA: FtsX-like permease family protein, partial [Candidatus Binataceae bacterium]